MNKIVSASEMSRIESLAYQNGASEEAFMESAARLVALKAIECISRHKCEKKVLLLCGKGNNGGDAFASGKYLLQRGIEVEALHLAKREESSHLCQKKAKEFEELGGKVRTFLGEGPIHLNEEGILIDGIFGTGFKGSVEGHFASVIKAANQSKLPILAIDIPSGINGTTGEIASEAIMATETLFLGLPKTGALIANAWNHVGQMHVENFGLQQKYIDEAKADFLLVNEKLAQSILPPIVRNQHKYQVGYVVGLGGSPGMPGAAMLSSYASLRAGAGIVRLLHPKGMESELSSSHMELIREAYNYDEIQKIGAALNKASGIFIGPGIGRDEQTKKLLLALLPLLEKKVVIDADALNILSEGNHEFPPNAVITPHRGEMQRLLHQEHIPFKELEFLQMCQRYSEVKNITIVLKGAPTFIFSPQEIPYINLRGDPGMATAGSGDVLTGIIAALLAQNRTPKEAALLGVFLHAVAGEHAALEKSSYSMISEDIIEALPTAFKELLSKK